MRFSKRTGNIRRRGVLGLLAAAGTASWGGIASAQSLQNRPVRMLIPFAPGGPTDLIGRTLAREMTRVLGHPVIVENRAGASGIIASQATAQAEPDGHTVLFHEVVATFAIQPEITKSLPYDTRRDFAPVGLAARGPIFLLVNSGVPARNVKEFVAAAKSGRFAFGSAGGAGQFPTHIGPELLMLKQGFQATHVPYKGTGPALVDLAAGRVQFMMTTGTGSARPFLDSGQIRAIAVTGTARSPALPDVPTFAEAGMSIPELDQGTAWGLFAPGRTPPAIVRTLNAAMGEALKSPELARVFATLDILPQSGTPEELQALIDREVRTWQPLLRRMDIKPE